MLSQSRRVRKSTQGSGGEGTEAFGVLRVPKQVADRGRTLQCAGDLELGRGEFEQNLPGLPSVKPPLSVSVLHTFLLS